MQDSEKDRCYGDRNDCLFKKTKIKNVIYEPYPKIIMFNINWPGTEVKPMDALKLLISLTDQFKLSDLYNTSVKQDK